MLLFSDLIKYASMPLPMFVSILTWLWHCHKAKDSIHCMLLRFTHPNFYRLNNCITSFKKITIFLCRNFKKHKSLVNFVWILIVLHCFQCQEMVLWSTENISDLSTLFILVWSREKKVIICLWFIVLSTRLK